MKLTEYRIKKDNIERSYTFALISDLHGNDPSDTVEILKKMCPDFILAAGDIFEPLNSKNDGPNAMGFKLLSEAAKIAPTVFSPGNHEVGGIRSWSPKWRFSYGVGKCYTEENLKKIKETGVFFLDDDMKEIEGILFGGVCSGLVNEGLAPDMDFISDFCKTKSDKLKILLCHHPEYYKKYLLDKDVDLIVSGHAHGGQWRIFGRGVFAPGQGLFPKYTSGVHDNKLVISRGLKKSRHIPRIFNPPEVVKIILEKTDCK